MRKITLLFALLAIITCTNAQTKQQGFGMHILGHDYYGPQAGKYFFQDVKNVKDTTKSTKKLFWDPAIRFSYWRNITKMLDLQAGISAGSVQMPQKLNDSSYQSSKFGASPRSEFGYFGLDAKINANLLNKEKNILAPYVTAGAEAISHQKHIGVNGAAGLGLNVNLGKGVYFNLESTYKIPFLAKKDYNHLTHSAGFVFWFGGAEKKAREPKVVAPVVEIPKDSDNDGIVDADDLCPTQPGKKEMNGCPDGDGDGIADSKDNCPTEAGSKALNGCPDGDNDGIADKDDKCATVAGIAKYEGCPIPDNDNDGFNNEVDRCPDVASTTNGGCPEIKADVIMKIEKAAKGVNFASGKAIILKKSFINLDNVAAIMNEDATLSLDISGHTDNSGKADLNLVLSQQRADACKTYLTSKGIDASRITATGFGDTMPIADNKTAAGKAQNRRTEFKLKN
jgi:outer membrane protein OmpA-like peptidoglycan-associated protein